MSEQLEIRRLISEQASSEVERREILRVARALEVGLAREVPPRAGFEADLRRRLLTEAIVDAARGQRPRRALREQVMTWVWGAGAVAAAAVVAILSYGAGRLNLIIPPTGPTSPGFTRTEVNPPVAPPLLTTQPAPPPVTVANLPDELPPAYFQGLNASDRVGQVEYQLATDLPAAGPAAQGGLKPKPPWDALQELNSMPLAGKAAHMTVTVQQVEIIYAVPPKAGAATRPLPYYRFRGVTDQGWSITRYVPAVKP